MSADQIRRELAAFGVALCEHPGWATRNHGSVNSHVIMVHDSVTGSMTDERAANFCIDGRSDLAGPLYECLVGHDGTAHLIAYGKTWNAGRGNAARLAQARAGRMPLDRELGRPGPDDTGTGNDITRAVAMITYGDGPYTPEQVEATARVIAGYCRALGWAQDGPPSVLGHSEYTSRKIDPQYDMGVLRSRVAALLVGTAETWHTVARGETLYGIARQYGTTVGELQRLNNLSGTLIKVGSRLRVR